MRRLLALLLLLVVAVAAATIAERPGHVAITWQHWQIDTSVSVLAAVLALLAIGLWLIFVLLTELIRLPRRFRRNRRERRRRAGELALVRGMAALSAGDSVAAQRYATRAELLLGDTPLALMLGAQAADINGDAPGARRRYLSLAEEKEATFFGLRGLIGHALQNDDGDDAARLASRARALRPNASWAFDTLFALQTRLRRWEEARETLADAARRRLLPAARAEHYRGVIAYELSLSAEREGDARRAVALATTADNVVHDLAPVAVRHARLMLAEGRNRAARRVVQQAWQRAPHPDLAQLWRELGDTAAALQSVTWFEKLAAHNPDALESAVGAAQAALNAQLWGEARRHLGRAIAAQPDGPSRRVCLLMARLEESEHPQQDCTRQWLDRALTAPPDPTYVCASCGAESAAWSALCNRCHGFDMLAWQTPPSRGAPCLAATMSANPPLPAANHFNAARQAPLADEKRA
jgi:HemY protein